MLGAQGHSGIARWVLGSLADYAVQHAPGSRRHLALTSDSAGCGVAFGTETSVTTTSNMEPSANGGAPHLKRTLTLPLLVFYGVGVTIGAGIFALIGEIMGVSGDQAPLAFLVAGVIAGVTGLSYMQLVRAFPARQVAKPSM